jgi:CHAT domain
LTAPSGSKSIGEQSMNRTVLIRIMDGAGDQRPVHLYRYDGTGGGLSGPLASEHLGPLELPDTMNAATGASVTEAIRNFVLTTEGVSRTGFEAIGKRLSEYLMVGSIGEKWREIVQAAGPAGVRLLLDVRPNDLAGLPWELMLDGPRWLATDATRPIIRVTKSFPGAADIRPVRGPLRILVVVGSKERDRVVDAEKEITQLKDAFRRLCGLVVWEVLHQPSRDDVRRDYQRMRPHVFHFIGHGDVDGDRGRLMLYDADADANRPWTTSEILGDLAGHQPRVAILNACRTTDVTSQEGAWRVADAFVELGVPAIIAMQADIQGSAAATFTGHLYRAISTAEPLDVAVANGRRGITDELTYDRRDFALPSLTVSAPPETIVRMRFSLGAETDAENLLKRCAAFVDRTRQRHQLWQDVDPDPDDPSGPPAPHALSILGKSQVGKSQLASWCVAACTLHGGNAAYVDLHRDKRLSFLGVLETIADAFANSPGHADANQKVFKDWHDSVESLGLGSETGPPPPTDVLETTFGSFSQALLSAANGDPLLLVLDHVDAVQEADWRLLSRWLLEPIARRNLEPVRVIVVVSEDDRQTLLSDAFEQSMAAPIKLGAFKPDEFGPVVEEYLSYHFKVARQDVEAKLAELQYQLDFTWEDIAYLPRLAAKWGWEPYR